MCKVSNAVRTTTPFTAVLLAILILVSWSCAFATVADDAQVQLNQGAKLTGQGRHADAIVEYQEVVTLYAEQGLTNPQVAGVVAEALNAKGDAQRQLGQLDDALATFSQVLSQYSQFRSTCCESTLNTAKIHQARNDNVTALQWYARVLRDYSDKINRADFAVVRALTLLKKTENVPQTTREELDAALAIYERTKAEEKEITTAIDNARTKAEKRSIAAARDDLLAVAENPALDIAHRRLLNLGMTQLAVGDRDNAKVTLNRLLSVAQDQTGPDDYRRMRMAALYNLGDYDAVISEGLEALSIYQDSPCVPEMKHYLARAYDRQNKIDECLKLYDDIISRYGEEKSSLEIRSIVATALMRSAARMRESGDTPRAISRYQRVVSDYPELPVTKSAAATLTRQQEGGSH